MIRVLSPGPALDVSHLVDRVEPGGIVRPREVLRLAGGKGVNLARAARTLGADARVVAPLGGRIGALVADLAAADGIRLDAVPVAGETRMCVSAIPDSGPPTELYEPAPELSESEAAALLGAVPVDGAASWLAVCGRLPSALSLDAVAATLERVRAAGTRIVVDTSGPGLAALLDRFAPDLVKVNRAEAAELVGGDGSAAELAVRIRTATGRAAVVTDGAAGAAGADGDGCWLAEPDPEPGRYGIGSGDSFLAGLLVGAESGQWLPAILVAASAAGSANSRMPGAGRLDPADVDAARARIRVVPA